MASVRPATRWRWSTLSRCSNGATRRRPTVTEPPSPVGEIPLSEFPDHGHALIDGVPESLAPPEQSPVLAQGRPGDTRASLPTEPPATAEPLAAILADFERQIMPGVTHW